MNQFSPPIFTLVRYFHSEIMHTIASSRQYINLILLRCCLTAVRNVGETWFLVLNWCVSLQIFEQIIWPASCFICWGNSRGRVLPSDVMSC